MQAVILIIVILTLLRGVAILKKALMLGSVEKQIKKAEENLAKLKEETTDGILIFAWCFGVIYGLTLISLACFVLFKLV